MKSYLKIIGLFLMWFLVLTLTSILSETVFKSWHQIGFLGGETKNYVALPQIFGWANFDGEHYLSIAIFGYLGLEQAFFPVYPILVGLLLILFSINLDQALIWGVIFGRLLSNLFFLGGLIIWWKLIRIDYQRRISFWSIVMLLIFPTSFYFSAVYSEGLYLLLSVLAFYFARKGQFLVGSIFGMIASATRIFGLLIFVSLLIELIVQKRPKREFLYLLLIPFGLIGYMSFLAVNFGDHLLFFKLQKEVGVQHGSNLVLLPQVYYRYLKMLLTTNLGDPIYQTVVLEFVTSISIIGLLTYGYFKRMRISYLIYGALILLLSSFQGSLSSLPRYILVAFPVFMAWGLFINVRDKLFQGMIVGLMIIGLIIETTLFLKGYWVA